MRNVLALVAAALVLVSCGGGGGGSSTPVVKEQDQTIDLGLVPGGEPSFVAAAIMRPFYPAATVEVAEDPADAFQPAAGAFPRVFDAGDRVAFLVAFTPPATPGSAEQAGTIRLVFRSTDGTETVIVNVHLQATIETPSARLSETAVFFGTAAIGEKVPFEIQFENTSKVTSISVKGVEIPAGEFAVAPDAFTTPALVAPGGKFPVRMVYAPTSEGDASSVVRVHHSASADPLEATLAGTGIAARILLDESAAVLDPVTGETDWISVDMGPNAVGMLIEAWGELFESSIDLVELEGPGGKVYENAQGTGPLAWRTGFPAGVPSVLAVAVPDSSRPEVQLVPGGGIYRFRLRDAHPTTTALAVRVSVSQRRAETVQEGTLNLQVYLADGLGIVDRSDPRSDAKLNSVIKSLDAVLATSGIRLGTISYSFLESPFDFMVDEEHIWNLLMVGSVPFSEGPINLYFVSAITYGVAAVAESDPGVTRIGTPYSGVVVDFNAGDATTVGAIAAHMIGHYLGQDGGGVFPTADEAYPMLRSPILDAGLPDEIVSPPEKTDYAWIHYKVNQLPAITSWCGSCARAPTR